MQNHFVCVAQAHTTYSKQKVVKWLLCMTLWPSPSSFGHLQLFTLTSPSPSGKNYANDLFLQGVHITSVYFKHFTKHKFMVHHYTLYIHMAPYMHVMHFILNTHIKLNTQFCVLYVFLFWVTYLCQSSPGNFIFYTVYWGYTTHHTNVIIWSMSEFFSLSNIYDYC